MIQAILARSLDGIIGTTGKDGPCLPWKLPPDLRRFRDLTTGHAIIMGRVTYDSIGKSLPNRTNIVVSRSRVDGPVHWCSTPESALDFALTVDPDPFIIGGAAIYAALWPRVDVVELTTVRTKVGLGLVFGWDQSGWAHETISDGEHNDLKYSFSRLVRLPGVKR